MRVGEMAGHAKDVDVASFEPGILKAPFVLDAKFADERRRVGLDQMRERLAQNLAVIGALHKAGVAIVPGSDTDWSATVSTASSSPGTCRRA